MTPSEIIAQLPLTQPLPEGDRTFLEASLQPFPRNPDFCTILYGNKDSLYTSFIHIKSGAVYREPILDDAFKRIAGVFFGLIFGRPVQMVLKTTYHLMIPLSFYREIKRSNKPWGEMVVRSLADIIRTPLYGIVLTILAIAGPILYLMPKYRPYLLNLQGISAAVERDLFWRDKTRSLARCMQPVDTLEGVRLRNRDYAIDYVTALPGSLEYGFKQLAASHSSWMNKVDKLDDCQISEIACQKISGT